MELRKITIWKLATVILAVLLVGSIFTSGFKGVTGAATAMSKSSAVQKALLYGHLRGFENSCTVYLCPVPCQILLDEVF